MCHFGGQVVGVSELECSMSCHSGKETSLHFSKHVQGTAASIRLFPGRGPAGSGGGRDWALSSSEPQSSDLFHEDDLSQSLATSLGGFKALPENPGGQGWLQGSFSQQGCPAAPHPTGRVIKGTQRAAPSTRGEGTQAGRSLLSRAHRKIC